MNKFLLIGINTIRGFSVPIFNFLIALFGIKTFGKQDWGNMINAILYIFLFVFIISWGNKEYLIRKYSENPGKMYHAFYSNFISRSMLLPLAFVLLFLFPIHISIWCILMVVLIHAYNALESLVIYNQKFGAQFLAEIIAFGFIITSIFYLETFNLETFLKIYSVAILFKIILLIISMQLWKESFSFKISLTEFKASFWFFMLGLSGWFISKIDIYVVDFYLPKAKLSEYQLLITAFLMLQAVSGFITVPFMKNLYRIPVNIINKIQKNLLLIALPIIAIGTIAIWVILEKLIQLNTPYYIYILGAFSALPSFFYIMDIMKLCKLHLERKVISINFISAIANFLIIILLIKEHQITGVFIGVACTQWLLLIIYKTYGKYTLSNL